ncbi:MAG: malto-oligosyltrehalose trehalohydrolase [Deferribacteres bacterium]|nr:malto-oligosyltrehalose trehalohydrolase [Deferribacteres bacterium]
MKIGADYRGNGRCEFSVWAPFAEHVELRILSEGERTLPMKRDGSGYWKVQARDVHPGCLYLYRLDRNRERPDPASCFQPHGVHEPSQVIDHAAFKWDDEGWRGIPLSEMIMYELHTGTFTPEGTFMAVIPMLDELRELGINAVELMPVAQFPGERNWGYDGVYPFAVQNSYGGPDGLKHLVNECHARGIAVILDVVYNHLGPEGNYLWDYGPYFTDRYRTPWGQAINFDGPYSNDVRNFFLENALHWFRHYHIDALRLDAIHGIYDMSAVPFLRELACRVKEFSQQEGRKFHLIAESDMNNSYAVRPESAGGLGLDALWCDDFHHSLHALVTGERNGYYIDFGGIEHFVKALKEGFVYSGQYSAFRKRNHGNSSRDIPSDRFVVFSQNHDQTGNRMRGERLSALVSFELQKLAAGAVILSPYVPLLFMGEEYGETAPFLFFTSHSDHELVRAVREGRKREFSSFMWNEEPPDPQDVETFMRSKLSWDRRRQGRHKVLLDLYRELIRLRKELPAVANPDRACLDVRADEERRLVIVRRWKGEDEVLILFNFSNADVRTDYLHHEIKWTKVLDSSDKTLKGPGALSPDRTEPGREIVLRAESFVLYTGVTPKV